MDTFGRRAGRNARLLWQHADYVVMSIFHGTGMLSLKGN